ncbi:MAG TPA: hypothetical protein VFO57_01560 [Burkholderiales bacterium]|nr:hypothetical protein [Burkholderiales bacterium]
MNRQDAKAAKESEIKLPNRTAKTAKHAKKVKRTTKLTEIYGRERLCRERPSLSDVLIGIRLPDISRENREANDY